MKFFTKDECAACKDRYDFKDRSFVTKKGRYYSEIHHFISLGKNKSLDLIENLTKLCPVCHRALGSGASDEKYQKMLIKNIMKNSKQNKDFAEFIFESSDNKILAQKIYENLK